MGYYILSIDLPAAKNVAVTVSAKFDSNVVSGGIMWCSPGTTGSSHGTAFGTLFALSVPPNMSYFGQMRGFIPSSTSSLGGTFSVSIPQSVDISLILYQTQTTKSTIATIPAGQTSAPIQWEGAESASEAGLTHDEARAAILRDITQ